MQYPAHYFTAPEDGGMSIEQQAYLLRLLRQCTDRFKILTVTAVWDFGRENGDPVCGPDGPYAESKDNAVYNAQMLTISYNHVRCREMPCETAPHKVREIIDEMRQVQALSERAAALEQTLFQEGVPFPEIPARTRERLLADFPERLFEPGRGNGLPLTHPLHAQVRAVRALEDLQTLERLTLHEIGHMVSELSGTVNDKRIKKRFRQCRDGFEDLYEFCAECFMAGELTGEIPLANEVADIIKGEVL